MYVCIHIYVDTYRYRYIYICTYICMYIFVSSINKKSIIEINFMLAAFKYFTST